MENKDTVGAISGYYDDKLSIAEVSESFLNNLGFRYDEFMQVTGGSFRKIFCGDNHIFRTGTLSSDKGDRRGTDADKGGSSSLCPHGKAGHTG